MFLFFRKILLFLVFTCIVVLNSCDAPRENPLDPDNPSNKLYIITGKLNTAEKTSRAIVDAKINWRNENLFGLTGDDGSFEIQCKSPINGWLFFEKTGFSSDSFYVDWSAGKRVTISPTLNALPVLDSIIIYSVVRNKYSNNEFLLYFEAIVEDSDDDVDSVIISCPDPALSVNLTKINADYFEAKSTDYELNLVNFNDIIGKPFYVEVVTSGGKSFNIGSTTIKRIIRDEIIVISPKNSDTLETRTPELYWTRFTPGFSFKYEIEIYTDEPEPTLLWKRENISSDEISIQVGTQLSVTSTNDKFFWVIWCIDEFNNKSRSKPAGFTLK